MESGEGLSKVAVLDDFFVPQTGIQALWLELQ